MTAFIGDDMSDKSPPLLTISMPSGPFMRKKLYVFSDRIEYSGETINFNNVQRLRLKWKRTQASALMTHDIEITFDLKGRENYTLFQNASGYLKFGADSSLVDVWKIVAQQTLKQRADSYVGVFHDKGYVNLGFGGRLHGTGLIEYEDQKFNLADCEIHPLCIVTKHGMFKNKEILYPAWDTDVTHRLVLHVSRLMEQAQGG